jgi:ATP-dependent exoDNAse (exonuclease V) beta subunit
MQDKTFQVYRTSAGAGKTYTIVREFIRLILSGKAKYDNVAAITFTNKAANEMKDRIMEYLFAISRSDLKRPEIASLVTQLSKSTGQSEEEIVYRCGKILTEILHNYARFSITTIDSFIHDVLRIFSHDLRLPDNFSVETDTDMLAEMMVSELLFGLESQSSDADTKLLSGYIINLALENFEEKDNWDITAELLKFAKLIFTEDGMNNIPSIAKRHISEFSAIITSLNKHIRDTYSEISQLGQKALELIAAEGFGEDDFYQKKRGIFSFFKKAAEANKHPELRPNSYVIQTIEEDKWAAAGKHIPPILKSGLTELFKQIDEHEGLKFLPLSIHIRMQIAPMALLGRMQQILSEFNETNQILPIAEFNKHISGIVRNEPAPFIYERLGQKYRHYLIDEFQDTSVLQWQNFLPLIENSLSQMNNVLIVGDVKQSIYRFRNGEMEQLMNLPDIYNKPAQSLHFDDIERALNDRFYDQSKDPGFENTNYRSGEHIVELNNKHFSWIGEKYAQNQLNPFVAEAYKNPSQLFAPGATDKGETFFYPMPGDNYHSHTFEKILQIIRSTAVKGDIAILTRGNANAAAIAGFLMQQDPPVPVISSESLRLGFSPAVNFIIDLLRIISNPDDGIAATGAYTFLQMHNQQVKSMFPEFSTWLNEHFFPSTIGERKVILRNLLKQAGLEEDISLLETMPLSDVVSIFIRSFNLATPPDAYILFFQNQLIDFINRNNEGLTGVLKWWEEKGKDISIIVPEGTDAVRILSVHKSKGLQFPVVIYPFADFRLKDTNSHIWVPQELLPDHIRKLSNFPGVNNLLMKLSAQGKLPEGQVKDFLQKEIMKQELDALNIHYVAMTRAKNSLHVLFREMPNAVEKPSFSKINEILSAFLSSYHEIFSIHEGFNCLYYGNSSESVKKQTPLSVQPVLEEYFIRKQSAVKIRSVAKGTGGARQTGELFHLFMEGTESLSGLSETFNGFCIKHNISDQKANILKNMLEQFTSHSGLRELFSSGMRQLNEATIIDRDKTYRPDKVIFNEHQTFVIDFKTGKKHTRHRDQVENYSSLLEKMGFRHIRKLLIYVSEDTLEIVEL